MALKRYDIHRMYAEMEVKDKHVVEEKIREIKTKESVCGRYRWGQ